MSVLGKCPSYRDANKGTKEGKRTTLGVRFTEVLVKRDSTVHGGLMHRRLSNTIRGEELPLNWIDLYQALRHKLQQGNLVPRFFLLLRRREKESPGNKVAENILRHCK